MDLDEIIKIIEALSKGCIYGTGEIVLPPEEYSKENEALQITLNILKKEKERLDKRENKPARNGHPWTSKEEERLCMAFDDYKKIGLNEKEIIKRLSVDHQRTSGAILARLQRKNKLPLDFYI